MSKNSASILPLGNLDRGIYRAVHQIGKMERLSDGEGRGRTADRPIRLSLGCASSEGLDMALYVLRQYNMSTDKCIYIQYFKLLLSY